VSLRCRVPFGRSEISFELPRGVEGTLVQSRSLPPLSDLAVAARASLAEPLDAPPLRSLARAGGSVCIVVTDATRSCPDEVLVTAILDELHAGGTRDGDVTILVATGLHRASTDAEKRAKLGDAIVERYRVVDHDARDPDALVDLGPTADGVPAVCNRLAAEADLLLATGVVEPHQFAGYSGARKVVAIGVAGEATIEHTHSPAFLDLPGTRLGVIDGNPFHEACLEIADRAGLTMCLNVALDEAGRAVAVAAGAHRSVLDYLVEVARSMSDVPIPSQVDIAVAGVGYPKDANLYQASRAASYLHFAPTQVVRPGGLIIIAAAIPEGAGRGAGEQRFVAALAGASDLRAYVEAAQRHGTRGGEQRAYLMARVLLSVGVMVVGAEHPAVVESAGMLAVPDIELALERATVLARATAPDPTAPLRVLVVPNALHTLPVVRAA
jgi:lactate racemase